MGKLKKLILDLLFPPRCAYCKEVVPIDEVLCEQCTGLLRDRFADVKLCPRCGKTAESCICKYGLCFKGCVTVFEYSGKTTSEIFRILKTDPESKMSDKLAELMAEKFAQSDISKLDFDFITNVPASSKTLEQKGFDHAALLAQKLSAIVGIPYCVPPIIRKDDSEIQHKLKGSQRRQNAEKSYRAAKDTSVFGRVLLVDDIITTGATRDICGRLLLSLGAKEVYCITAATTLSSNKKQQK